MGRFADEKPNALIDVADITDRRTSTIKDEVKIATRVKKFISIDNYSVAYSTSIGGAVDSVDRSVDPWRLVARGTSNNEFRANK